MSENEIEFLQVLCHL